MHELAGRPWPRPERASAPIELLDDRELLDFVVRGYRVVGPCGPRALHDRIHERLSALDQNPGDALFEEVPELEEVYSSPGVRGAIISLLGVDARMNRHVNLHRSGPESQWWHQDSVNFRHHEMWRVLAMYYPQDVTAELGPTVVLPGSHLRNAPTDRLATYVNLHDQVPLLAEAGSVVVAHFDIWHAGSRNRTERDRFMVKAIFDRASEPDRPTWNHDPTTADGLARHALNLGMAARCSQSDKIKERLLRAQMWNHLCGRGHGCIAGSFDGHVLRER